MKLWQAHAVVEIMRAIAAPPLTTPEGEWMSVDDSFVPFVNGEEGDDDGIMSATAEFVRQLDAEREMVMYTVNVEPGDRELEVIATLLFGEVGPPEILLERTIDVPSPHEHDYLVAEYSLSRLGHSIADAFVEKVTEDLAKR